MDYQSRLQLGPFGFRRPFSEWWLTATGVRMMLRSEVFCGLAWSAPQISPDAEKGCTIHRSALEHVHQGLQVRRDLRHDDGLLWKAGHQSPKLPHLEFDYHIWHPNFLVEPTYILYISYYMRKATCLWRGKTLRIDPMECRKMAQQGHSGVPKNGHLCVCVNNGSLLFSYI